MPIRRLLGWAVVLTLALWFFGPVSTVLLALLGAGALASALVPLRDRLPFGRASGVVAGLVPPLVLVLVVGGLGLLAASQIHVERQSWQSVVDSVNGKLAQWSSSLGVESAPTVQSLAERATTWFGASDLATVVGGLFGGLVTLVLIGFGTIFLLAEDTAGWTRRPLRWLLPQRHEAVRDGVRDLSVQLRHWVVGTLVSMAVAGSAAGLAFWLIGLRLPLTLGLIAGLSEIVPTLGPVAAFALAAVVAATQDWNTLLGVSIAYCAIQLLESYVLVPLVMKRAVRMPALVTLFTVVLWGKVFGLGGLLLAIPIDLAIVHLLPALRGSPTPSATAAA